MNESITATNLNDGELLAAIDIGSNSYHMVIARHLLGQLRIVDRHRENVRMAAGLQADGTLDKVTLRRCLDCLAKMKQRLAGIPKKQVRAIATNTVRRLANPDDFLLPAEAALGRGIEVVAGREEARLVYLGVAHALPPEQARRLVVDIGGGSTECIIGENHRALKRESIQMGCVATTLQYFGDGTITAARWDKGLIKLLTEFQKFDADYRDFGWQESIGSSGTFKAARKIARKMKLSDGTLTPEVISAIKHKLIEIGDIERLELPGLSRNRKHSITGGLLVIDAVFRALQIESMSVSKAAMREGILYDMLGRAADSDIREASVIALTHRYQCDLVQANRVTESALLMFDQIKEHAGLYREDRRRLRWACALHELGLAISHSQHQIHGAYIIEHSDIAGFSVDEQQVIAALIQNQRRDFSRNVLQSLPERLKTRSKILMVIMRLAVLLHRSPTDRMPDTLVLSRKSAKKYQLTLPDEWLAEHPLTLSDLKNERNELSSANISLSWQ